MGARTLPHWLVFLFIVSIQAWWTNTYHPSFPHTTLISMLITCFTFITSSIAFYSSSYFDFYNHQISRSIKVLLFSYGITFFFILLFRLDYSRPILLFGCICSALWFSGYHYWQAKKTPIIFHVLGNIKNLNYANHPNIVFKYFECEPNLKEVNAGVIVDLHAPLTDKQQRFLAECVLSNIPVIDLSSLHEHLTGKLSTTHLSENALGTLESNSLYAKFKATVERIIILCALPVLVPTLFLIAAIIKVVDRGEVFYTQERVGHKNKRFTIYKFKTMRDSAPLGSSPFATHQSQRISKLGKLLRRSRLDEIPQFWNVLKGEMSIIGPRPEQALLVETFSRDIPFYSYRHIVKPGLTGWAQVNLGYTDSISSSKEKLAYDLFYLKHCGLALDFQILCRTIVVVVTGKGAF